MHAAQTKNSLGSAQHAAPQRTSSRQSMKSLMNSAIGKFCHVNSYVKVDIDGTRHLVKIAHSKLTCGWLLAQVKSLFEKGSLEKKEVVAVRTESGNVTLDYYLTLLER